MKTKTPNLGSARCLSKILSERLLYITESSMLDIFNHVHLLPSSGALEHGMRMFFFHMGEKF